MRVETLMRRVGAEYASLRFFKRDLKGVLENFLGRGWIRSYGFTAGASGDLLELVKVPTPSQQRALAGR